MTVTVVGDTPTICTISGQTLNMGDANIPFDLSSLLSDPNSSDTLTVTADTDDHNIATSALFKGSRTNVVVRHARQHQVLLAGKFTYTTEYGF